MKFTRGSLKEQNHYYPFGLPIGTLGSVASGFTLNRSRYQSNEYKKEQGLNWMDFHNRQYDPQLGRFLSIDPMAEATADMSPYTGMNNNPVLITDPLGLRGGYNTGTIATSYVPAPVMPYGSSLNYQPGGDGSKASDAFNDMRAQQVIAQQRMDAWAKMIGIASFSQGVAVPFNNGEATSGDQYGNTLKEVVVTDRGFFRKVWNGVKSRWNNLIGGVKDLLKRGDDFVQGHSTENYAKQTQNGGEEFKDKNIGVAHSGFSSNFFNRKWSINNAGNLVTLAGGWGTNPSATWSNWKSSFDFFTNSYNLTTDGTSQLNDVMKENGLFAPTHGYEVKVMIGNNGVYGVYDDRSDTIGLSSSLDSLMSTIRKK